MTKERFNKHMRNGALAEKVFMTAKEGLWPVGLSTDLVIAQDQEFGTVFVTKEEELSNGLYEIVRSDGTIECLVIGGEY